MRSDLEGDRQRSTDRKEEKRRKEKKRKEKIWIWVELELEQFGWSDWSDWSHLSSTQRGAQHPRPLTTSATPIRSGMSSVEFS